MTMRAAVMRCEQIVVEDVPIPTPGAGDVLVKVRACGICGSDLHYNQHMHHLVGNARKLGFPVDELERDRTELVRLIAHLGVDVGVDGVGICSGHQQRVAIGR